ncbi:MAG TPA: amidohydrolase [Vicinamibacterales bacterium]|nr:amidohydrolase [Vicinamibacterales bacterium]
MLRRTCLVVALAVMAACGATPGPDVIFVNGKVFTSNAQAPWAEAVAIRGERIVAVGDNATISASARGHTRRIDIGGRVLVPGFNDAHTHIDIAPPSDRIDTPFDPTVAQIEDALRPLIKATAAGRLVVGEFAERAWSDPGFNRSWLDAVAPDHPVWLTAFTGHGALLNSKALTLARIGDTAPRVGGGVFGVDANGRLNGRLEEYAQTLANRRRAEATDASEVTRLYRQYAADARAFGITTTQLLGDVLPAAAAAEALVTASAPMRWRYFRFPVSVDGETLDSKPPLPPQPSPLIDMRGMKWALDGTPIERLAFMRAPYADAPGQSGRLNLPVERIDQFVGWAYGSEDPLAVHAFGDAAIEAYIAAVERNGRAEVWRRKRPRIEHADMMAPDLIPRAKAVGMLVTQNPTHFTFPEIFLARYGKERVAWMQPMKSLLDAGIPLAIGSDGPMNPFLNIMAAVTHPVNPREALTREQAVIAYTAGSAFAEFKDHEKGQIAVGMLADLAVLSADVFSVPVTELEQIRSVLTMLGGRVVHETGVVR